MKFGIDVVSEKPKASMRLFNGQRVGLVAHPASVDRSLLHSADVLISLGVHLSCAFGPQHGMRGDKQYNMQESADYVDARHGFPVFSLYGESRKPTAEMLSHCDGVVVDLQDVGCRIYTYLTTLAYVMQACAEHKKWVMVLDRPNPAGRVFEGNILAPGQESFVGVAPILMRHGMTLGEIAPWLKAYFKLDLDLTVIPCEGYSMTNSPDYGWPVDRAFINPSPNIPNLSSVRVYAGSVLLEGTHLSEGRGTTRPFEYIGHPRLDIKKVLDHMTKTQPTWLEGLGVRPCSFEPTFYKHQGELCNGMQLHAEGHHYNPNTAKPFRLISLWLKTIRQVHPEIELWRDFPYEYVYDRLAIDVIAGGSALREWIEDSEATCGDFEKELKKQETQWEDQMGEYLLYP
jgi:uncharacterized protein YbbC (DUF1343 family)